jgi:hypothetical protein
LVLPKISPPIWPGGHNYKNWEKGNYSKAK